MNDTLLNWFRRLRCDRVVCDLIPMEADMGYPLELRPGEEYLVPFCITRRSLGVCCPPLAYIRVSYPDGRVLTYNDLRSAGAGRKESIAMSPDAPDSDDEYYGFLESRIGSAADSESADDILLEHAARLSLELVPYYRMLIKEKERYMEGHAS